MYTLYKYDISTNSSILFLKINLFYKQFLFFLFQQQLFTCTGLLLCISLVSAQLTYHLDANTNSYTLQTPNSQQTFTQHFNTRSGAANANQIQTAQSQPQQQVNLKLSVEHSFFLCFIF